jgi:hypothetical protein
MKTLTHANVAELLNQSTDPRVCEMANDAAIVGACTDVLNEALALSCLVGTTQLQIGPAAPSRATPVPPAPSNSSKAWSLGSQGLKSVNATLEMAADPPRNKAELATALAKKGLTLTGMAESVTDHVAFRATNFIGGQMMSSLSLAKVATMTPQRAGVVITLTVAEKITGVAGFAQLDPCRVAIASLATTSGLTVAAAPTGIGAVVGAIAIAAEAFNVVGQCRAPTN